MKTSAETWTVREILNEVKNGVLAPNPEYQRGPVWSTRQRQMLIDSLMRGFHLPIFYFHEIDVKGRRGISYRYEIIDGQQRVDSIVGFHRGDFSLLDPTAPGSRFPLHLRNAKPDWSGMQFDRMPEELRKRFLDCEVSVVEITESTPDESRDLFVRLNSGSDLRQQERRDALPGRFCEFVNDVGGRMYRMPGGKKRLKGGRPLFLDIMKLKPMTDRGSTREFVARLAIILYNYRREGRFAEITQSTINDFYYVHLNWDPNSQDALALTKTVDEIYDNLKRWDGPKLLKHEIIHSLLLWTELDGYYKSDWKTRYHECLAEFKAQLLAANATGTLVQPDPMWTRYGSLTRVQANKARTIQERHEFFREWMMQRLNPQPLGASRVFNPDVKQQAWLKAKGVCAYSNQPEWCQDAVPINFYESEFHHIIPYSDGGSSTLDNVAVTHKACNRKIGAQHVPVIDNDGTRRLGAKVDAS